MVAALDYGSSTPDSGTRLREETYAEYLQACRFESDYLPRFAFVALMQSKRFLPVRLVVQVHPRAL